MEHEILEYRTFESENKQLVNKINILQDKIKTLSAATGNLDYDPETTRVRTLDSSST